MQEQNLGQKSCKTQWSKTGHKLRTGKNLPDLGCIFFKHSCHRSFKRDLTTESKWPWKIFLNHGRSQEHGLKQVFQNRVILTGLLFKSNLTKPLQTLRTHFPLPSQ